LNKKDLLKVVRTSVCKQFETDTSGHDHFHIQRVVKLAIHIGKKENADILDCQLIAWLHEMDDYKLTSGDGNCEKLLRKLGVEESYITYLTNACSQISFKGNAVNTKPQLLESMVVQDADRLDAIGAIGIARTFAYGGKKGQSIYHPNIPVQEHHSFEEYKNAKTTTVNHFYEKLLLLKDLMNTSEGKRIAQRRHTFLKNYLDQFLKEWDSVDI